MNDIETSSVQIVFTSPPYWDLRNYEVGDKNNPELGHEATPQEYVKNLSLILRDVKRVLNDKGSFFLNVADTYRVNPHEMANRIEPFALNLAASHSQYQRIYGFRYQRHLQPRRSP